MLMLLLPLLSVSLSRSCRRRPVVVSNLSFVLSYLYLVFLTFDNIFVCFEARKKSLSYYTRFTSLLRLLSSSSFQASHHCIIILLLLLFLCLLLLLLLLLLYHCSYCRYVVFGLVFFMWFHLKDEEVIAVDNDVGAIPVNTTTTLASASAIFSIATIILVVALVIVVAVVIIVWMIWITSQRLKPSNAWSPFCSFGLLADGVLLLASFCLRCAVFSRFLKRHVLLNGI